MDAQLVTGKKSEKVRKRQLVSAEVSDSRCTSAIFRCFVSGRVGGL